MNKNLILILIGIITLAVGCEASDPIDDIYTRDILPGNGAYTVGTTDRPYSAGYFNNIETSGIIATDINAISADIDGLTLDGVDMASHASTHQFDGSDEINIKDLMTLRVPGFTAVTGASGIYTATLTGGRGSTASALLTMATITGNVAGDITGLVSWSGPYFLTSWDLSHMRYSLQINSQSSSSNMEAWWGFYSNSTTYPTDISKHFAIHQHDGAFYACSGNGTHNNETALFNHVGSWHVADIAIKYAANGITYYAPGYDVTATHTTNIPSGTFLYPGMWVKTINGTVFQTESIMPKYLRGS